MDDVHPYCIVHTTIDSEARADTLGRALVQARLAACVQVQPIKSIYRWEEKLCCEPEYLLTIKTRSQRFDQVAEFIRAHHPYATPEIVQLPIAAGSEDYLRWLHENTEPGPHPG